MIRRNTHLGGQLYRSTAGQICPIVCDDVVIYTESIILGPVTIGERAGIGAPAWVEENVIPGTVVHRTR